MATKRIRARNRGKATERKVAELLGGKRTGYLIGMPDVDSERYAVECKHRKILPAWIKDAMIQAQKYATGTQIPIVVLHEEGAKRYYVLLDMKDFLRITKEDK
jgi:hypothetical protein